MLASVKFDDERRLAVSEVGKIRTHRRLPHELRAVQATIAQAMPKLALGFGWDGAKLLRAGRGWQVSGAHRWP